MQRLSLFALVLAVCLALSSAFVPAPRVLKPVARVSSRVWGCSCGWGCVGFASCGVTAACRGLGWAGAGPAAQPSPAQPSQFDAFLSCTYGLVD